MELAPPQVGNVCGTVFFKNLMAPGIQHTGDNLTGEGAALCTMGAEGWGARCQSDQVWGVTLPSWHGVGGAADAMGRGGKGARGAAGIMYDAPIDIA